MNQKRKNIFFALLALLAPLMATAQFTETREIEKRFRVYPDTRIEITNKYGKIELNTWDRDSAVFQINIKVEDNKLQKLEKAIEDIDIDITDSRHFLIVRTKIGESLNPVEKEIRRFRETLMQSGGNTEINYTVWLPASNELKVENKFGDIIIGDHRGEIEINLSNGNLKAHDLAGTTRLDLNFADATINRIESARLNANYSDVYLKEAEKIRITGKSSEYEIIETGSLDADSRRDKFRIRRAHRIDANGSFTNFSISELTGQLALRAEYGNIEIDKVDSKFGNIYIESKSADIGINFDPKSNFGFEITHARAEVSFAPQISITGRETLDEKLNRIKVTGNFGSSAGEIKLLINADSGSIKIGSN